MENTDLVQFKRDKRDVLRLLGNAEAALSFSQAQAILKAEWEVTQVARSRFCYQCFPRRELEPYLQGKDVQRHLGAAPEVVVLAASLGSEVDFAIRRAQTLDMSYALVLDAVASVFVEKYMDSLELSLRQAYRDKGLYLSTRFAPGYGDFPLSMVKVFLSKIQAYQKMALSFSAQSLMKPVKSILVIMGVGEAELISELEQGLSMTNSCDFCSLSKDCILKSRGAYCGKYCEA